MKTLILYYSYTGHTKKIAEELAASESAELVRISEEERPGKFKAFTVGCFGAMRGKAWPIKPIGADLNAYDRLIVLSPVWAGNPPPYVHALFEQLPDGKEVAVKMISGSGDNNCKGRVESLLKAKNCKLADFEEIKA